MSLNHLTTKALTLSKNLHHQTISLLIHYLSLLYQSQMVQNKLDMSKCLPQQRTLSSTAIPIDIYHHITTCLNIQKLHRPTSYKSLIDERPHNKYPI